MPVNGHLQSSRACYDSCDTECFTILDSAASKFKIKIKEALHIKWESPIRSVIIRVITKSDDRAAGVRFVYHEYD